MTVVEFHSETGEILQTFYIPMKIVFLLGVQGRPIIQATESENFKDGWFADSKPV